MKAMVIRGDDIRVGDVIKSAAMRHPLKVTRVMGSSTGRTREVRGDLQDVGDAFGRGWTYRIGLASKVRLITRGEATR